MKCEENDTTIRATYLHEPQQMNDREIIARKHDA